MIPPALMGLSRAWVHNVFNHLDSSLVRRGDGFIIPMMNKLMKTRVIGASMGFTKLPKPVCCRINRWGENLL
ncbi:hypothetical protein CMV_001490 [Castanea mollissima]|uniref:Uncharacterized protein n=1 Tax=Castanea mollissima TaxID=60419 RepID=A0A8J4RRG4_9ROSI|nr:hypothetical protein CMV_001490 [Castanea mollissima]